MSLSPPDDMRILCLCSPRAVFLLGEVRGAGITRSGVSIPQMLSSDPADGEGEAFLFEGRPAIRATFFPGLGVRMRYDKELLADPIDCRSISTSLLSLFSFVGVGSLSVGGGPENLPIVVNVRDKLLRWVAFKRSEVDLRIVDS
jgi:hypothetical protein